MCFAPRHEMILAGDIGGTNVRLGCFDLKSGRLVAGLRWVRPSRAFPRLETAVSQFLSETGLKPSGASFGIAGPVIRGVAKTPNLPWTVESEALSAAAGLPATGLLNDLEANAYGLAVIEPGKLETLQAGLGDPVGHVAIVSAGTGLGEAGLMFDDQHLRPFPSEGGHSDFAPTDDLQVDLLRHLQGRFGRVSCERVLSGPGLVNIFDFLTHTGRGEASEALVAEVTNQGAAAVSTAALTGRWSRASLALDVFVTVYGAVAGNVALTLKATRGVFLGGGIAPRILPMLRGPRFLEAFHNKGRMRPLLETIPVRVILDDDCALLGAAYHAATQCGLLAPGMVR